MTPLERAARAAARSSAACSAEDRDEYEADWAGYVPLVRAVLQAIREPSEAVLKVMRDTVPVDGHDWEYRDDEAVAHWQAMIDAALEEGR